MDNSSLLVGLDLGTTSVKAVASDGKGNQSRVIGAVDVPMAGMRNGKIVDIDQVAGSVSRALSSLSEKVNAKIYRVVTAIPVGLLRLQSIRGQIDFGQNGKEINDQDVKVVIQTAIKQVLNDGLDAISFIPSRFILDGGTDVDDPRKMLARSLSVEGVLYTAQTSDLHNIQTAIKRAGYQNNFFVPTPLAIASVALSEGERTFGSIILDLGGGTTTATVIQDNRISYAFSDSAEGADTITNDISVVLKTDRQSAERAKRDYGFASSKLASEKDEFPLQVVGSAPRQMVNEKYLSEIIEARVEQILSRVGRNLDNHDAFDLPGGVVITGGGSALAGISEVVAEMYDVKCRIYQPEQMGLRDPIYAASFGVVSYAQALADIDFLVNSAIYGSDALGENYQIAQESGKTPARHSLTGESNAKEEYNDGITPRASKHTRREKNGRKKRSGISDFFNKFFN